MHVRFRLLEAEDLELLHRWLNEPGVVTWWEGDDVSWEGVVDDYEPPWDDGTEHWIAEVEGEPVGWIQWAAASDHADFAPWFALGMDRTAAGVDYLIGDPERRGAGLGATMIRAFVDEVVFGRHPHVTQAGADPADGNRASWRALEKAGFRFVGMIDHPDGRFRLMAIDRPA